MLMEASRHIARVSGEVTPAVVHIVAEHDSRSGGTVEETGSGVLMQSPKYRGIFVLTNRHVVVGATKNDIDIHLNDGRVIHPTGLLEDISTDLAIMTVDAPNLTVGKWGDSDNIDIGHMVLAMGSPFGLSQSVTMGIVSAKGRRSLSLGGPREVINQDFIQTDAAINPGNSGGPLVDLQGRIIGINTAIASQGGGNEGIGFSIPINLVRYVVEELLEHGRVQRGFLGVKLDNEFNEDAARRLTLDRLRGARVVHIYPDTPAGVAGVKIDDVILNFDGIDVEDESHLIHRVSLTPVNKSVRVVVLRSGREVALQVTLSERQDPRTAEPEAPKTQRTNRIFPGSLQYKEIGLSVHRLDTGLAVQLGHQDSTKGVLVMQVPDSTRTDASDETQQLALYDIIEAVARTTVNNVDEFDAAMAHAPSDAPVLLKVRRMVDGKPTTRLVLYSR